MDKMENILHGFLQMPLYRDFARPELCKMLAERGISKNTPFTWKVSDKEMRIYSSAFDLDNYYVAAEEYFDDLNGYEVLPAISTTDIAAFLALYSFSFNFYCSNTQVFHGFLYALPGPNLTPHMQAKRLPDLMAMLAIEAIDRKLFTATQLNEYVTAKVITIKNKP